MYKYTPAGLNTEPRFKTTVLRILSSENFQSMIDNADVNTSVIGHIVKTHFRQNTDNKRSDTETNIQTRINAKLAEIRPSTEIFLGRSYVIWLMGGRIDCICFLGISK